MTLVCITTGTGDPGCAVGRDDAVQGQAHERAALTGPGGQESARHQTAAGQSGHHGGDHFHRGKRSP